MTAVSVAVLSYSHMYDQLSAYKKNVIDPTRNLEDRRMSMPPTILESQEHLRIDAKSLSFIFRSTQAQALPNALNAESAFFRAVGCIAERNRIHFEECHPRMNEAGVREGDHFTTPEFEEILTHGIFAKVGRITDSVTRMVDDTLPKLKNAADGLASATKELYPEEEPRTFDPVDPPDSDRSDLW